MCTLIFTVLNTAVLAGAMRCES